MLSGPEGRAADQKPSFEATITPAFVLIISMWYRRNEQAGRMSMWLAANGVATIICSPVAYGLSGLTHPLIESWRILYILVGSSIRHFSQRR
jgi:ACS family allantoate permease-like MFS transporter